MRSDRARGRRRAIASLAAGAALVTTAWIGAPSAGTPTKGEVQAQASASLPNILVIVTDDQRPDTLDVMPALQQLFVLNGTQFPNAFASTPLCCPSRASIFSGRYTHNHGVFRSGTDPAVFDQDATMQARLQKAGYSTAIAGKYLNSWDQSLDPPFFDRWAFFSRGAQSGSAGFYDLRFNVDGKRRTAKKYSTHFIRNQALRFLESSEADDDRPWFLYVAPFAPHPPAEPEPRYSRAKVPEWEMSPAAFEEDILDKPAYMQFSNAKKWRVGRLRKAQLRSLMSVDDLIERLFNRLDRLGEKQETLAVFLSDNGFMWGEHRRMGKSVPYTASTQIPMLVRWPGHVRRGAIDQRFASNVDVGPTALDAAGLSAEAMDGRSLIDRSWQRDRILLEFWEGQNETRPIPRWASLRTTEHQYTEYYARGTDGQVVIEREFYDLVADPWQLENLVSDEDPTNDPPQWMVDQLFTDRSCASTSCP